MVENPNEDTEPRVQRLFVGSYLERGMWPQGLAGAGLSVFYTAPQVMLIAMWSKNPNEEEITKEDVQNKTRKRVLLSILQVFLFFLIFLSYIVFEQVDGVISFLVPNLVVLVWLFLFFYKREL
jgi:hypothetical protein